jgi:hypothetical protein
MIATFATCRRQLTRVRWQLAVKKFPDSRKKRAVKIFFWFLTHKRHESKSKLVTTGRYAHKGTIFKSLKRGGGGVVGARKEKRLTNLDPK